MSRRFARPAVRTPSTDRGSRSADHPRHPNPTFDSTAHRSCPHPWPSHRATSDPRCSDGFLRVNAPRPDSRARQILSTGGTLVTLDDATQRAAAESDPRSFVERNSAGPLIIDEVQFAPTLFRALKAAVDRDRRPGRFVLTGSTRLLSTKGFADALVGRLEVIELWPFSQGELHDSPDGFVDWAFADRRGVPPTNSGCRRVPLMDISPCSRTSSSSSSSLHGRRISQRR